MSIGAWIMLAVGTTVLGGGLVVCLRIAMRRKPPSESS